MTIFPPPVIPSQSPVTQRPRDPNRRNGYRSPRFAGTFLNVLAVFWGCLGSAGCTAAILIFAGAASFGTSSDGSEAETAAANSAGAALGFLGAIPFLVAGLLCLLAALICWLGSVRFRWMSAMYAKLG